MYKTFTTERGVGIIRVNQDGSTSYLPTDPANTDYQAYLKWIAEGNQPLPADEPQE